MILQITTDTLTIDRERIIATQAERRLLATFFQSLTSIVKDGYFLYFSSEEMRAVYRHRETTLSRLIAIADGVNGEHPECRLAASRYILRLNRIEPAAER